MDLHDASPRLADRRPSRCAPRRRSRSARRLGTVGIAVALATTGVVVAAPAASPSAAGVSDVGCSAMTTPVYGRGNPQSSNLLLTLSSAEATEATGKYGFTTDRGVMFLASPTPAAGLVAVHRLQSSATGAFRYTTDSEVPEGWVDRKADFYVADTARGCAAAMRVYSRGDDRFYANSKGDQDRAVAGQWQDDGVAFYAKRQSYRDTHFSFAVLPDTQEETNNQYDTRFQNRTAWLASQRADLDLRWALHTGDVTNWGWVAPHQYSTASEAMTNLERAGIPYALTVGNHDTRVVGWDGHGGYGGSAYVYNPECRQRFGDGCDSRTLLRQTQEFNEVFSAKRYGNVRGTQTEGTVDNYWTSYMAGGKRWLVVTLELWPRPEMVTWAQQVVASHPHANVIVQTHHYLMKDGTIGEKDGGYGDTSPSYLEKNLISQYPNIKLVVSGHLAQSAHRVDTYSVRTSSGTVSNKVVSLMGTFHAAAPDNPVQIVDVDTAAGTLASTFRDPAVDHGSLFRKNRYVVKGLTFVDPPR